MSRYAIQVPVAYYKLALGVRLGLGFISTSPRNNTKRICKQKEVFTEKPIRKRNQTKWRFCDHYISIPEFKKQTNWKYLGNYSGNYWYLHNLRKKMFYGFVETCSFKCWRSPLPHYIVYSKYSKVKIYQNISILFK